MGVENLLNAETKSFGEIIKGDNVFRVPVFQRDYSWENDHWEDLWADINSARTNNTRHYMGSIVLINRDKKNYDVIDGQQRLTTLTIIILAVIGNMKALIDQNIDVENNTKRVDLLMNEYIGKKSLQSLNFNNKLILNEINDPFYSTYLINFRPLNGKINGSNKQLYTCYSYFFDKIAQEVLIKGIDELISFVEFISDNLVVIQISATNDFSAYIIFETLTIED